MKELTHDDLVKIAKHWLWKNCVVVVTEMKLPSREGEVVDAIGWDYGGWSIVIECKITRADFLREKRKRHHKEKEGGMGSKKYFLMPKGLITTDELPTGWGLLECIDRKRTPKIIRYPLLKEDINLGREILLLISCLRRIGGLRDGISVKCYQFHSKNRATLGINKKEEKR